MGNSGKNTAQVLCEVKSEVQQIADLCAMMSLVGPGVAIDPESFCGAMCLCRDRLAAQADVLEEITLEG